jgi:hypothetical protein
MFAGEVIAKKLRGWSNEAFAKEGGVGLGEANIGVVAGVGDVLGFGELLGSRLGFDKVSPKVIAATVRTNNTITNVALIFLFILLAYSD